MSNRHQLGAEHWRVIGHLYQPSLISPASRRRDPSLQVICKTQEVTRDAVVDVVDRGLVEARLGLRGDLIPLDAVRRLPDSIVRLRITKAGMYHASHDPQHVVLCALRAAPGLSAYTLEHALVMGVTFGELCDLAERSLITAYLGEDSEAEVNLRDWRACSSFVYAQLTDRGRTFVAYQ